MEAWDTWDPELCAFPARWLLPCRHWHDGSRWSCPQPHRLFDLQCAMAKQRHNATLIPLGGRIWSGPTGWLSESPCSRRLSSSCYSCWHRPLHTVLQNPTARPWMTALAEAAKVASEAATNLEIFFQCFTAFPMTHDDTNFVHLFLFPLDKPHQTRWRCEMCQVQVSCRRIMQYQAWCGCIYRRNKTYLCIYRRNKT